MNRYAAILGCILILAVHEPPMSQDRWRLERVIHVSGPNERIRLNAIDVSLNGTIYASDVLGNRLMRISPSGAISGWIGGFGWEAEQFDEPADVWAASGLDILVADMNNHRIQRFDRELNYISELDGTGSAGDAAFEYPASVALSSRGELYVADTENSRILKFGSDGRFLLEFGGLSYGSGRSVEPVRIEVTSRDGVLAADMGRKVILLYDDFGNYLRSYGEGIMDEPVSVASDPSGRVYALDAGKRRILIFSEGGSITDEILLDNFPSGISTPVDICFSSGIIYLLDASTSSIFIIERR